MNPECFNLDGFHENDFLMTVTEPMQEYLARYPETLGCAGRRSL